MTQDEEIGEHFLGAEECTFEHKHASAEPIQENLPRIGKERAAAHLPEDRDPVTAQGKKRNETNENAIVGKTTGEQEREGLDWRELPDPGEAPSPAD